MVSGSVYADPGGGGVEARIDSVVVGGGEGWWW